MAKQAEPHMCWCDVCGRTLRGRDVLAEGSDNCSGQIELVEPTEWLAGIVGKNAHLTEAGKAFVATFSPSEPPNG